MERPLKLSDLQLSDWEAVSRIAPADLDRAVTALEAQRHPEVVASKLIGAFGRYTPDAEAARSLVRQILSLATFARERKIESLSVVESMIAGVRQSSLGTDVQERLATLSGLLTRLLDNESVVLTAKALSISFDYDNVLSGSSVFTDVRPIFSSTRNEIEGALISYALRLKYSSAGRRAELSLALDSKDVQTLIDDLQQAQHKSSVAKKTIADKLGKSVIVAGEETYGFD